MKRLLLRASTCKAFRFYRVFRLKDLVVCVEIRKSCDHDASICYCCFSAVHVLAMPSKYSLSHEQLLPNWSTTFFINASPSSSSKSRLEVFFPGTLPQFLLFRQLLLPQQVTTSSTASSHVTIVATGVNSTSAFLTKPNNPFYLQWLHKRGLR